MSNLFDINYQALFATGKLKNARLPTLANNEKEARMLQDNNEDFPCGVIGSI